MGERKKAERISLSGLLFSSLREAYFLAGSAYIIIYRLAGWGSRLAGRWILAGARCYLAGMRAASQFWIGMIITLIYPLPLRNGFQPMDLHFDANVRPSGV